MLKQRKIIIGMSGGVDSSVAAYLLKQQGFAVTGVYMRNWQADDFDPHCPSDQDQVDAEAVCKLLNIPFQVVSFAKNYWQQVFQHFLDEYAKGHTPNPDVLCNKEIKFKAFLNYAIDQGADRIATGHYVRNRQINDHFALLRGVDPNKDQSYFLAAISQTALAKSIFPLGELEKNQVRKIADQLNLPNAKKKDSTGICFIGERKFKTFLNEYLLAKPGETHDDQGQLLGQHEGLMFYTIGQRQGLKIGGLKNHNGLPWFVLKKDLKNNVLVVGQGHDHPWLLTNQLLCENLHWIQGTAPNMPLSCTAKIRYRSQDAACVVTPKDGKYLVTFGAKQRAVTPGQVIVFYDHEICLGSATILE